MATDGPDPTPCEDEVFQYGEVVFITHSIPSNAMEGWVKEVAALSGQRVDWHFVGGRAIVKVLGNIDLVVAAMNNLRGKHDDLYRAAVGDYPPPPWFFLATTGVAEVPVRAHE